MGLTAREMGMECNAPPIGIPCDLKFMECCTGITDPPPDSGEYENVTGETSKLRHTNNSQRCVQLSNCPSIYMCIQ